MASNNKVLIDVSFNFMIVINAIIYNKTNKIVTLEKNKTNSIYMNIFI